MLTWLQVHMLQNFKVQRSLKVILSITGALALLTQCVNNTASEKQAASKAGIKLHYSDYTGSAKCASCHKDVYDEHIKTAHYFTSKPPEERYILGSFKEADNTYAYSNDVTVKMEKKDSGLYQMIYYKDSLYKALRFGLITGSGVKGQTFAYWRGDQLLQMPITYFSAAHQWANSPGFPPRVLTTRAITSRCLECHTTFVEQISPPDIEYEEYDHNKIVYGIDCEKCHGPGAEHVAYQQKHPADTIAKYIVNPASFTRQQKLDMCAVCHGGHMQKIKPSFSFKPGDALSKYFMVSSAPVDVRQVDVHGNQYGLLSASKCFKNSQVMTCNTCHDAHKNERGNIATFSQKCMSCHNAETHNPICKMTAKLGAETISKNCIDCHMPNYPSRIIALQLKGNQMPTASYFRSHYISVYPEESKKIEAYMKQASHKN